MRLSHSDWYGVALAAESRQMFSLAADAYERSMLFTDFDTERVRHKMETKNNGAFRRLEGMRAQAQK